jgi:SPP1 gp7 family putative phage head morphogenesis protein
MHRKIKLSPKKSKWLGKRSVAIKGTPLNYNASLQVQYQRALRQLVREMTRETEKRIMALFDTKHSENYFRMQEKATMDASITSKAKKLLNELTKRFSQLFNKKAGLFADKMLKGTLKYSEISLKSSLKKLSGGLTLNTGVIPAGMEDVAKAIIEENVKLIKSIPDKYYDDVSGMIMRSIASGDNVNIEPMLKKYSGISDRKVSLMALDQTRKAYNTINKQRMQSLGIKKFEWIHSGGSQEPRQSHMDLDGRIFSFDDLPLKGEEGFINGQFPGQAINCRCRMGPVIEFENGETA